MTDVESSTVDPNATALPTNPTQDIQSTKFNPSDIPLPPRYVKQDLLPPRPQQDALTKYGQSQQTVEETLPFFTEQEDDQRGFNYDAGTIASLKRNVIQDGAFQNIARWTEQVHGSMQDPDPVQAKRIQEAMPELMQGLAPSDYDYIADQPTFELAEQEAQRLRDDYWWQQARENEGFLQGMVAGIGGFILDPINIIPGALIYKGVAIPSKLGMAASKAGGMSLAKGSIAGNALKWGAAGGAEEIIRAYPRLQADPLFQEREYWESIMYAGGFGAVIPALPILGKTAGSLGSRGVIELENAYRNIANSNAGISLAQTLRTMNNVVADLDTSSAKAFKNQDLGQKWQNNKAEVIRKADIEGDKLRGRSYKETVSEARTTFDNGQYQKLGDEGVDAAADALIKAGVMTKEAAETLVNTVKGAGKFALDVGEKVVTDERVRAAGKQVVERSKQELQAAKETAKVAANNTVSTLLRSDEILTNLGKSTLQGAKNVGPIARDMKRIISKVNQKQATLDKASNPDLAKKQMTHIEAQAKRVDDVLKKTKEPSTLPKDFTSSDISKPNTISRPDVRGELTNELEKLETLVDSSFGSDTAGAARVKRTRWGKFKEEARGAQERAVYEAREAIEDLKITRDEMLAELPDITSAEMRRNVSYVFDQKINALNHITDVKAQRHGVRPKQQEFPTANEQVQGTLDPARREAKAGFKAVDARLKELIPDSKNIGVGKKLSTGYNKAIADTLIESLDKGSRLDFNLLNEDRLMEALDFTLSDISSAKGAKMMQRISDKFEQNYAVIREDLSLENIKTKDIDTMMEMLDTTVDHVAGKFNTMEAQFLSPIENSLYVDPVHQVMSDQFQQSGWQPLLEEQFVNNKRNLAIAKQAGGLTHSLQSQVLASGAPLQQNFGMRVFETSAGYGGDRIAPTNTAAIVADNLHNETLTPYLRAYDDFQNEWAKEQEWSWLQQKQNYKGHAEGYKDIAHMNETLMIAQNNRRLGKAETHDSPAVTKMLKSTDEAYQRIHEIQMESGIEGVTKDNQIKHHQKQVWNDEKLLQMTSAPGGVEAVTELFQKGLRAGGLDEADAYTVARGFLDSKHSDLHSPRLGGNQKLTEQTVNGAMPSIMKLTDSMRKKGVNEQDISRITAAINETAAGIDGPGYLQHQLKMDYEATVPFNGKEVRIVDMLDLDTAGHLERQSKESAGLVAINDSFDGQMNSYQAIEDYLTSMGKEAHSMGAKNLSREIRNGVGMLTGTEYDGQLPTRLRMIRGHLQLTSMGGLMESQLAEAGLSITRGSASVAAMRQVKDARKGDRRVRQGRDVNTLPPAIRENTELLAEMQSVASNFTDMAELQRNNVVFDAADLGVRGEQLGGLDRGLDIATGGKYRPAMHSAQNRLTGFGKIRSMEDDVASMSVLNDMARLFIDRKTGELNRPGKGTSSTSEGRWADMGLDTSEQSVIRKLFDPIDGHIRVDEHTGNVTRLNIEDWSVADKRTMGVLLGRNASRQIQKGYVGESSPVLMHPMWAFLTQFRSYTMIAAEKQQVRNMKFADKEMATGMVLNAATSAISRMIRIQSLALSKPMDDREEYRAHKMESIGYETIKYMAMAATIPELSAMINQVVGQPFGAHPGGEVRGGEDLVPALSYFSRLMEAQDAGIPTTDAERGRLQALIQLGTIKQANILFGLLRTWLDD